MPNVKPWERGLLALAAAKVGLGVVAFAASAATRWSELAPRDLLLLAHVLAFAGTAAFLLSSGHRDRRAVLLGAAFALTASSFADSGPRVLRDDDVLMSLVSPVFAMRPDAFGAYFLCALSRSSRGCRPSGHVGRRCGSGRGFRSSWERSSSSSMRPTKSRLSSPGSACFAPGGSTSCRVLPTWGRGFGLRSTPSPCRRSPSWSGVRDRRTPRSVAEPAFW
jgi:hypothetical protein